MVFEITRRSLVQGATALAGAACWPRSGNAIGKLSFAGVNLAGGEFGKIPGTYTKDYIFPTEAEIDYYARLGFNLIRIPFRWERLQPKLNAAFAPQEQRHLLSAVESATSKGMYVVLDTHNYAKRRIADDEWAAEYLIGSTQVPAAAFADYCGRLAQAFKGNASVIFGLMNEPAQIGVEAWLPIANDGIASIRSERAQQLILVPGVDYTGAHSWLTAHNDHMANVVDPEHNVAIEVHQYFDQDSSGTSATAVNDHIGSERIAAFQNWAREKGFKAFLGEFAAGSDATSLAALRDLCGTLEANPDIWLGWSAWAGGSWWADDYMFKLDQSASGKARPQTEILSEFARRISAPTKKT
jgi:endoglucanase